CSTRLVAGAPAEPSTKWIRRSPRVAASRVADSATRNTTARLGIDSRPDAAAATAGTVMNDATSTGGPMRPTRRLGDAQPAGAPAVLLAAVVVAAVVVVLIGCAPVRRRPVLR